jgi:hypothetical protein
MSGRLVLGLGGLVALVIAAVWSRAEPAHAPIGRPQLASGRFYAIDLSGSDAAFDLALDADSRYEMIVSSLGDAGQVHRVRIEASPRTRVESFLAIAVADLHKGLQRHEFEQHTPEAHVPASRVVSGEYDSTPADSERRFFLHVTADALEDERGYVPVQGMLTAEGMCVRVYLDRDVRESDLAPGLIGEIIRLLDDEIIPRSAKLIGQHADVDGDGKLAVLITAWLARLCGGRTALKGFVRANDFQPDVPAPFSNRADVVYLNSSLETGTALKTLLAHEYTHAVCFSQRLADPLRAARLPEEDWLNEAIAHLAENLHANDESNRDWSNLDKRIAAFLAAPQSSPLVVRDYYRAGLWRDQGCRGATYLFLRYFIDQFGEQLLRDLVDSPASGRCNLERATGIAFPEMFRRWTIALARDEIASVRLHERIGECDLAGLERIEWRHDAGTCELDLRGTSTSLVVLKDSGKAPATRFHVHTGGAARLQLTLVRYAQ